MNMVPSFTTLRSFISYQFTALRVRALRDQWLAKLFGAQAQLLLFPGSEQRLSPSRRLIGLQSIRVDQVIGALNKNTEFDNQFRPLKKHSLDRWLNAYLLHERDEWSPIIVHKVGEQYFVENGHYRVSVARFVNMEFIDAIVWEHATQSRYMDSCPRAICTEKSSEKVYVAG